MALGNNSETRGLNMWQELLSFYVRGGSGAPLGHCDVEIRCNGSGGRGGGIGANLGIRCHKLVIAAVSRNSVFILV